MFAFGCDPSSDKYKVVAMALTELLQSEKTEIKVYDMGDSCWRNLEGFPDLRSLPKVCGVYMGGTLNWVLIKAKIAATFEIVIISVDLQKETCRSLCLPDDLWAVDINIGVFRDSQCVWQDYNNTHIGLLREFGDDRSWIQ